MCPLLFILPIHCSYLDPINFPLLIGSLIDCYCNLRLMAIHQSYLLIRWAIIGSDSGFGLTEITCIAAVLCHSTLWSPRFFVLCVMINYLWVKIVLLTVWLKSKEQLFSSDRTGVRCPRLEYLADLSRQGFLFWPRCQLLPFIPPSPPLWKYLLTMINPAYIITHLSW